VLDPRTRLILHGLVNAGALLEVQGVVKGGKEACVFYGTFKKITAFFHVFIGDSDCQSHCTFFEVQLHEAA
jgi:serine/threonine-protein kinase RIO1